MDMRLFIRLQQTKPVIYSAVKKMGKNYVPGTNELFIYHEPAQKKRGFCQDCFITKAISQNKNSERNNRRQAER